MSEVRVRLQMGSLHMEFRGEEAVFERTIDPLLLDLARGCGMRARRGGNGVARPQRPVTSHLEPAPEGGSESSGAYQPPLDHFGTFQRQLDPAKNGAINRIAAFAFFLWNYERKETFTEREVLGCFLADGQAVPKDAEDAYETLVTKRILAPGRDDGTWQLTSKGQAHVRHHLLTA